MDQKSKQKIEFRGTAHDMTTGNPFSIIWRFSMPMILSMLFQQLYNIADSVIAGKFVSVNALAAVGASYPINMLFIAVASGASIGCSVIVSQVFGAKAFRTLRTTISTALISLTALGLILTGIGFIICKPLLMVLGTPTSIFNDSALYLRIYIGGLAFLFIYNASTSIFNGLGNSKLPLYFLIFSSVFNIILAVVFVTMFHMGVSGVAWATFIAQGISSILAATTLLIRVRHIPVEGGYDLFDIDVLKSICRIAIPSIFQQSFVSVGQLLVQGLINGYGPVVVAGYAAAFKVHTFSLMTMATMSGALSSFAAQNIGAGKIDRAKKGFRAALILSESLIVVIGILVMFFAHSIISIFVPNGLGHDVISSGSILLWTLVPFYPIVALKNICDGVLRGAGDMKRFMITTFTDLVLRVVLSYIFSPIWGYTGILWTYPIGWVVGTTLSVVFFAGGWWKKKRLTI